MGTNIQQRGLGGMAFVDDATSSEHFIVGGSNNRNSKIARVPIIGVAATTGGGIFAWQNPENVPIIIGKFEIDITTPSTGAAAGSFGTGATATTSSANLIDSYALATAAAVINNSANPGANGKGVQKLPVGQYVTGTGAATTVGLVGTAYIHYYLT